MGYQYSNIENVKVPKNIMVTVRIPDSADLTQAQRLLTLKESIRVTEVNVRPLFVVVYGF